MFANSQNRNELSKGLLTKNNFEVFLKKNIKKFFSKKLFRGIQ